ncbi:MAG: ABC transporter ATP-binding protein [Oligoflexia bacterium]|nr:MAG: ABC transporter ATP-binding protein [Oligoflexia bacterium]
MSLIIDNLRKVYQQGDQQIEVLKGVQAEIQEGEIVAIVGQSGSGKSTLLGLLSGLDRATSGMIKIQNTDFNQLSEKQMTEFRAKNIGIVFQQFHLLPHLTALENVMVPLEILGFQNPEAEAKKMLDAVGLSHRYDHLPAKLSGGECQRVAIARALVTQPKILLADEPSGNLDDETGEKVMSVFFDVVRKYKITTILVTHNDDLARRCHRQLVLKQGVFH